MSRIPLPTIRVEQGAQGHPFPWQIAFQTEEFIQGALFYATFADLAAGETVARPGGIESVEVRMKNNGLNASIAEESWRLLHKYQEVFGNVVFQSVLVTLCSHWDWYIRKLAGFVLFARENLQKAQLPKEIQNTLQKPDRSSIKNQIEAIYNAAESKSPLSKEEIQVVSEMSLVRNLGLHNRWEVDELYARQTKTTSPPIGNLRIVQVDELYRWHSLLRRLLHETADNCSRSFHKAPTYTIY